MGQQQLEDLLPGCQRCNESICSDAAQGRECSLQSNRSSCTTLELALLARHHMCPASVLHYSFGTVVTLSLMYLMMLFLQCSAMSACQCQEEACSLST